MYSIEASILVNAPVETCYERWMDFERFPEFMPSVLGVRRVDARRFSGETRPGGPPLDPQKRYSETMAAQVAEQIAWHGEDAWEWMVRGPFGRTYSWVAGIVQNIPNKIVSFASSADQEIPVGGSVNFLPQPGNRQTLVEVKMSYSAPAAPFGELIADITRYGTHIVNDCLTDFKRYVERETQGLMNPANRDQTAAMQGEAEVREALGASATTRG